MGEPAKKLEKVEPQAPPPEEPPPRTLAEKMAAAMGEVGAVGHDAKNDHQGYAYTSAAAVLAKCQKALSRQGIAVSSDFETVSSEWLETKNGGKRWLVFMRCKLTFTDGSGETVTSVGHGSGMDNGDKAPMKAQTASYKYAMSAALCIGLGDDPEADSSTDREQIAGAPPKQTRQPARQTPAQQPAQESGDGPDYVLPMGKYQGTRLGDVNAGYLEAMVSRFRDDLEAGKARNAKRTRDLLERFELELERRAAVSTQDVSETLGDDQIPF